MGFPDGSVVKNPPAYIMLYLFTLCTVRLQILLSLIFS